MPESTTRNAAGPWVTFVLLILATIGGFGSLLYLDAFRGGPSATGAYPDGAAPSTDDAVLAAGRAVFARNCASCHGAQGGGLSGPNLCDDDVIHGETFSDLVATIRDGVPFKGMIAWGTVLPSRDIQAVASYAWTLRGTSPALPDPPRGSPGPDA